MNRRGAFNLLESLVVLGIFVVLAALLAPIFIRTYIDPRRRSACQTQEKQIALALLQYTRDFNNRFPPVGPNGTDGAMTNQGGWADSLQPYIKSTEVFHCPSAIAPASGDAWISYGYNRLLAQMSPSRHE